jgi:hypothetical protein
MSALLERSEGTFSAKMSNSYKLPVACLDPACNLKLVT